MPFGTSDAPAPVKPGKLGDVEVAGRLTLMRGVNLTPTSYNYVFNISEYTQQVPKGSRSYMLHGVDQRRDHTNKSVPSPSIEVDGKQVKYQIGAVVPSVVIDSWVDQLGKRQITTQDGEEVAQDILCPAIAPQSENNDLNKWGCGYFNRDANVENPVPTADELRPVLQAYEATMRAWVEDADNQVAQGHPELVNPIHIRAANYFRLNRPYTQKIEHPSECPGCGEPMKKNALRHTVQSGGCGFVATENRKRAFELGLVTREEAEMWGLLPAKATK